MNKQNLGFTLIELLVVIAIIGILSGVVIAFLIGAKNSGNDVAIKSNLREIRNLAENYYQVSGKYSDINCGGQSLVSSCLGTAGNTCGNGAANFIGAWDGVAPSTDVQKRIVDANNASGGGSTLPQTGNTRCKLTSQDWAVAVKLKSDPNTWWCVDSAGINKSFTVANAPVGATNDPSAYCH